MPCPNVAHSLLSPSAVVTRSLSLDVQVGPIPGLPNASVPFIGVLLYARQRRGNLLGPQKMILIIMLLAATRVTRATREAEAHPRPDLVVSEPSPDGGPGHILPMSDDGVTVLATSHKRTLLR